MEELTTNDPYEQIFKPTTGSLTIWEKNFQDKRDVHVVIISDTLEKLQMMGTRAITLNIQECPNLKSASCSNNKLTKIITHKNLLNLNCCHNNLSELTLNDELENLYCMNNNISELKVNDQLITLFCNQNQISKLILNKKLRLLYCSFNKLRTIQANRNLVLLVCKNNDLKHLYLNRNLLKLDCKNNQLTNLEVNKKLQFLVCNGNYLSYLRLNKKISLRDIRLGPSKVDDDVFVAPYYTPHFNAHPDDENEFCSICLESDGLIITNCGHIFHYECIMRVLNALCPCCRSPIPQFTI